MSGLAKVDNKAVKLERVLIEGDLGKLSAEERVSYYNMVCESLGLNPYSRPFDYLRLNGREVLYAKKDATDQLRKVHAVSVKIVSREKVDDVFVVTAQATMPDGRADESVGAVTVGNLRGDALANALMKAETKAKRRVTLSICGLGILDETEIETIPNAQVSVSPPSVESGNGDGPQVSDGEKQPCPECGNEMMISLYGTDPKPWYCKPCKKRIPR